MAYTTASDVKSYAGWAADTDVIDDTLLAKLIARATEIAESITGRIFEAASDTRYFDAIEDIDGVYLLLDQDLAVVTTITNGDTVEVASDEYVTEPRKDTPFYAIKLLASSGKAWTYSGDPENAISVLGDWGYSATPPDDIVHATIRLTKWLYDQHSTSAVDDRPVVLESGVTILPSRLPADIREILSHYVRLEMA